jgi:mannose-6-phosphate isomerase-like protein (cupin superfamily)
VFASKQMRTAIAELGSGGTGMLVPDGIWPYHITCAELYFGVTTPKAIERPHWHFRGWEGYVVVEGEAFMLVRWHDAVAVEWERRMLHPGDTILIAPGVCHWFRWQSQDGYAVVFKAPTIPGIGRPPNGKQQCQNGCHLYKNGCVLPDGFAID